MIAGLLEVEPLIGDSPEMWRIRWCEFCFESPTCVAEPRAIYWDPIAGIDVCENCVADYLAENPP